MSIVEDGRSPLNPNLIRWTGYGLGLGSVAVALAAGWTSNQWLAVAAIASAIVPVVIALIRPELFEFRARAGKRGFNPAVGAGACTLIFVALWVNFIDLTSFWVLAAVGATVGLAVGFLASRRAGVGSPIMVVIFTVIFGAAYAPGAFGLADTTFDRAAGTPYQVVVQGEHESYSSKGGATYYLDLPPWGPRKTPDSVSVTEDVYTGASPGVPVCITEHPGALNQAWYTVANCPAGGPPAFDFVPPTL